MIYISENTPLLWGVGGNRENWIFFKRKAQGLKLCFYGLLCLD